MDPSDITDEIYFGELKLMFATEGWKILMYELKDAVAVQGDIQNILSADQLHFNRGQLAQLARMLNFEDTIKRAQEEQVDESP
jgi:hypothetical protein